ncbi:butyrophilin-like protein 3 [Garra rufa]|uniref:butyrophilin-like protein 3 n=1 Tax=Garra rufa TaxID=137080 RepID=UPI003CCE5704
MPETTCFFSFTEQHEVVGPADPVLAVAGEDVILPCSIRPHISVVDMRVEWFRSDQRGSLVHLYEDHEDRNTYQIQSYRSRTKLNHQELQRGSASLKISSVRVSDEGLYKCFIQSKSWYDDTTVNVSVEAVGHLPVITVDGFDHFGGLRLQCESEGWYPEPDLEWLNSEGVRLSSETTETHRNGDRFSLKNTMTVYERDSKIHCRFKLKHHMLETMIITTSNMFNHWRTSVILISVFVVLSVIAAGILIAVFAHKNKERIQLQNERSQLQNEHSQLQNEHRQLQNEHRQIQDEKRRIQHELDQIFECLKTLIPKALMYLGKKTELSLECDHLFRVSKDTYTSLTHFRTHKVNVILDADMAYPRLIVSDDGKQVRYENTETKRVTGGKDRFDDNLGVLGKDGFSSGCFYFEVQVNGQTEWYLGLTRESVKRKGTVHLSPEDGYWTLFLKDRKYQAHDSSYYSLSLSVNPQRVGVFVDYEKGLVSFYDVGSMSHIYSYTDQSFDEKLYPFVSFGCGWNENSTPLIICDDY